MTRKKRMLILSIAVISLILITVGGLLWVLSTSSKLRYIEESQVTKVIKEHELSAEEKIDIFRCLEIFPTDFLVKLEELEATLSQEELASYQEAYRVRLTNQGVEAALIDEDLVEFMAHKDLTDPEEDTVLDFVTAFYEMVKNSQNYELLYESSHSEEVLRYEVKEEKKVYFLQDFCDPKEKDYTEAILDAHTYLSSIGGGELIFTEGDYLIRAGEIHIPSNIKWLGQGKVRLYSQEKDPYNILISTERGAKNIHIKNITFDQLGDEPFLPDINQYEGAFLFHVNDTDEVTIEQCTFYSYGVCALLVQSSYDQPSERIRVINNQAYFERKYDEFYDVSVFNVDARYVTFENNQVEGINSIGGKYWKPRCAFEVHMPVGTVLNNTSINTEVGIIHVNWPMLWDTYDEKSEGELVISGNTIQGAIVGISLWGATTLGETPTKNMQILNNLIELKLEKNYIPAQGIAVYNGGLGFSTMSNLTIAENQITMVVGSEIGNVNREMDGYIPGADVGAISLNSTNRLDTVVIRDNVVKNFPFNFLNLGLRKDNGAVHENITVTGNLIEEVAYVRTNDKEQEAVFNVDQVKNILFEANEVKVSDPKIEIYDIGSEVSELIK